MLIEITTTAVSIVVLFASLSLLSAMCGSCSHLLAKWRRDKEHSEERSLFASNERRLRTLISSERNDDLVHLARLQRKFCETMKRSRLVYSGTFRENLSSKAASQRNVDGRLTKDKNTNKWELFVGFRSCFSDVKKRSGNINNNICRSSPAHPSAVRIPIDGDGRNDGDVAMTPLLSSQQDEPTRHGQTNTGNDKADEEDEDIALVEYDFRCYIDKLSNYATKVSDIVYAVLSPSRRVLFVECKAKELVLLFSLVAAPDGTSYAARVPAIVDLQVMDLFSCVESEPIYFALFFAYVMERDHAADEVVRLVLEARESIEAREAEFNAASEKVRSRVAQELPMQQRGGNGGNDDGLLQLLMGNAKRSGAASSLDSPSSLTALTALTTFNSVDDDDYVVLSATAESAATFGTNRPIVKNPLEHLTEWHSAKKRPTQSISASAAMPSTAVAAAAAARASTFSSPLLQTPQQRHHSSSKAAAAAAAASGAKNPTLAQQFMSCLSPDVVDLVTARRIAGQRLHFAVARAKMLMRFLLGESLPGIRTQPAALTSLATIDVGAEKEPLVLTPPAVALSAAQAASATELEFLALKNLCKFPQPELLPRAARILWSLHMDQLIHVQRHWKQFLCSFEADSLPVSPSVLFSFVSRAAQEVMNKGASHSSSAGESSNNNNNVVKHFAGSYMPPAPRLPPALEAYKQSVVADELDRAGNYTDSLDSDNGSPISAFFTNLSAIWSWQMLSTISTDGLVSFLRNSVPTLTRAAASLVLLEGCFFGQGVSRNQQRLWTSSGDPPYSAATIEALKTENADELFPAAFEEKVWRLEQQWRCAVAQHEQQRARISEQEHVLMAKLRVALSPLDSKQVEFQLQSIRAELAPALEAVQKLQAEEVRPLLNLRPEFALMIPSFAGS